MMMTFHTGYDTFLFSGWTPNNQAQYAGTCLFIIFVALLYRAIRTKEHDVFRWSVTLPNALKGTIKAAAGYCLMIAVMSMNVGYGLSTLAGLFLGSLIFRN